MATSGSTNFTLNRDQIIQQALGHLGKYSPYKTVHPNLLADDAISLNLMLKSWQNDGVILWLNEEVCLFQQYATQFYSIGPSGSNCALLSDSFKTQIASDAASGASTITVDSDDDIADGDYIGIQLDDGTLQWTTVDGTPALNVVTLDDVLTDTATSDNWVFTYTSKISRPTDIIEARVRDTDDVDTPVEIITSRTEFLSQTDKESTGRVLDVYYSPTITNGLLYTWPVCGTGDITDRIIMSVQRVFEDFDASANNLDGPPEALNAVVWCLAEELMGKYEVDPNSAKGQNVIKNAAKYYSQLKWRYASLEPIQMRP